MRQAPRVSIRKHKEVTQRLLNKAVADERDNNARDNAIGLIIQALVMHKILEEKIEEVPQEGGEPLQIKTFTIKEPSPIIVPQGLIHTP